MFNLITAVKLLSILRLKWTMYHSGMLTVVGSWILTVLSALQQRYTCKLQGGWGICNASTMHAIISLTTMPHRAQINNHNLFALKDLVFTVSPGQHIDLRFE